MIEAVIVAIIGGACSLAGVYISNRKASAVQEFRLKALEEKVDKHNQVIARTYELEKQMAVVQEDIKNIESEMDKTE